jgi:hypothetical protein
MRDRAVAVVAIGAAVVAVVAIGAGMLLGAAPSPAVAIRPMASQATTAVPASAPPSPSAIASASAGVEPSPSASIEPAATPDPVVSIDVKVVACKTVDASGQAREKLPKTERMRLPASVAGRLVLFATTGGRVLGPAGWRCTAEIGGNGSLAMAVASGKASQSISVDDAMGTFSGAIDIACPYFTDAARQAKELYGSVCDGPPAGEQVERVGKTIARFTDPSGAMGAVLYVGGRDLTAARVSCTIAAPDDDLCRFVVDDWVRRHP